MTKKTRKPTPRNELGRTATEQAAIDKITDMVEAVLTGQIEASGTGYLAKPHNVGTDSPFTKRNKGTAIFASLGTGDPRFVSYSEAKKRGWECKGAKGYPFLRPNVKTFENAQGEEEQRQFFTTYYLFNLADIEHDLDTTPAGEASPEGELAANTLLECVDTLGAELVRSATTAMVVPSANLVNIPAASCFKSWNLYVGTIAHELSHFVGRNETSVKQYDKYRGFEELVAEVSACLVLMQIGMDFEAKHAAYIAGWLTHAKTTHKDPLYEAIVEATKRSDVILETYDKVIARIQKAA